MLAAVVSFLGCFGSPGEPQGGAMAAQGPPGVGAVHATPCYPRGGGSFRRLQKSCQVSF